MADYTKTRGIPLSLLYTKPDIVYPSSSTLDKDVTVGNPVDIGISGIPLSLLLRAPFIVYHSSCTLGKDVRDGTSVDIGIGERQSGLYILGKPRMGKSWLMVNLILEDIKTRRGIFFLDPHGDAIDDLKRTKSTHLALTSLSAQI